MECNKDEAIRAKDLAEKKMQNNDFDGARKFALRAQQLFPDLENISHLLAVCNVHCSAQSKTLGSEKDWYSILQVERLADDTTIRKQYRKLALMLHPDKNKFPGAEAAFKLIGEAHVVLSDHGKRSLYDSKLGISIKSAQTKPPAQQVYRNQSSRKQHVFQNNIPNHFSSQANGLNRMTQSNPSFSQECFWTCCPFCNIKYQYYRSFVNRALRCQKCAKPFIAYDIAAQGVPPSTNRSQAATQGVAQSTNQSQAATQGVAQSTNQSQAATQSVPARPNWRQPQFFEQKEIPVQGSHNTVTMGTAGFPASSSRFQDGVDPDSGTQMRSTDGVSSHFGTQNKTNPVVARTEDVAASSRVDDAKPGDESNVRQRKRKRGNKMEAERIESCDTSSSSESEEMIIEENVSDLAARQNSGVNDFYERRRSSRQKHQVSYIESEGEDDVLENPYKRPREDESSGAKGQQEAKDDADSHHDNSFKQKKGDPSKGSTPEGNNPLFKNQKTEQASDAPENGMKKAEIVDDSESDASSDDDQGPIVFHCPDPEFHDFDKDREQSCFAVDQFWACYGYADGMPRYYAQIRKVYSSGFRLRITWLEPDPDDENDINWVDVGLPVGCGKYRRGGSQDTTDRLTFSHQVVCEKGSKRGSFFVYPREGEIWALFKDWDIKWSSEPENHKINNFEIVEVLSNFSENVGVKVTLLDKVRGFVSLVHHKSESGTGAFVIPPNEICRFSHRIPSWKMNGTEKEGVPRGSFELDPASLPANPDAVYYPSTSKMDDKLGAEGNYVCQDSSVAKKRSKMSENSSTPKRSDQCNGKRGSGGEDSVLRRSPRGLNSANKENKKVNARDVPGERTTVDNLNSREGRSCKAEDLSHQGEEIDEQIYDSCPRRSSSVSSSISPSRYVSQDLFHDFNSDRSIGKFAEGQIWALYRPEDKLPKVYGQIRKVGHGPVILHVALFEGCWVTKNDTRLVCGSFKGQNGRPRSFDPSCFSHMLDAKVINKNRFEFYPKEGQVWALYKKWHPELSSSDMENCEYDIVEIIGSTDGHIKASTLIPLKGYKSVFRSPRSRSSIGSVDILETELGRFSHQIPAFRLTTEKGGSLAGCWELDPAAVPSNVLAEK